MTKNQNGTINLLKFIMAVGIFLVHAAMEFDFPQFQGTWIFVEWFYIFAGYCVTKEALNSTKDVGELTFSILKKRILAIYPYFFAACLIGMALKIVSGCYTISSVHDLEPLAADFLMLQATGITTHSIVGVSWFLSSMWIVLAFLIPAIAGMKKYFVNVLALLIPLLIYGYLDRTTGYLWETPVWVGFFTKGTLRAAAALCLGAFSYGLGERIRESLVRPKAEAAAVYFFYLLLFIFTYKCDDSKWYFLIPLFMTAAIAVTMVKKPGWDVPDNRLTRFAGRMSMLLYLNHYCVIFCIKEKCPGWPVGKKLLVTAAASCICMAVSCFGGEFLKKTLKK